MEQEQFLTAGDASHLLNRTPASIRIYARSGRLPYSMTAGGMRLFRRSDVLALRSTLRDKAETSLTTSELDANADESEPATPTLDRAGGRAAPDALDAPTPGVGARRVSLPPGWVCTHPDAQPSR